MDALRSEWLVLVLCLFLLYSATAQAEETPLPAEQELTPADIEFLFWWHEHLPPEFQVHRVVRV
jgi:hypothetical protein